MESVNIDQLNGLVYSDGLPFMPPNCFCFLSIYFSVYPMSQL